MDTFNSAGSCYLFRDLAMSMEAHTQVPAPSDSAFFFFRRMATVFFGFLWLALKTRADCLDPPFFEHERSIDVAILGVFADDTDKD